MTTLTRASFKERSSALGLSSARRIEGIDGLRGIALTLVVLFHLFGNGRVSGGVDVFLVVSGFGLIPFRRSSRCESRPVARGCGQGDRSDHVEQQELSHSGAGRA